jgi:putative tryptophan/tyrosine transport system substrate-binding protein
MPAISRHRSASGLREGHSAGSKILLSLCLDRPSRALGKAMRRRDFIGLLASTTAWPLAARAQPAGKAYGIGFFSAGAAAGTPALPALLEGLKRRGWVEGKNIDIKYRYADNRVDRLGELAAELVRLNVDVIVAVGTLAPLAAKHATATIPIVMTSAGDPLGSGLVSNLARPDGNVTGLSLMSPDLSAKRLELLKEIIPDIARLAVIWNADNPYPALVYRQTESAARQLKIEVQSLAVRTAEDVTRALAAAVQEKANALISVEDPLTQTYRRQIADFATRNRLPSMSGLRDYADAGGLLSYGPDLADLYRRAADYVDKILKGAKPSELPVEQPTKFELVVNLKTAKTLSLAIAPDMLAIADAVIE